MHKLSLLALVTITTTSLLNASWSELSHRQQCTYIHIVDIDEKDNIDVLMGTRQGHTHVVTALDTMFNNSKTDLCKSKSTAIKLTPVITHEELTERIYKNEIGSNPDNIVIWNSKENFPSLGIGHCIWYQNGETYKYKETFPDLIKFMSDNGVKIPTYLQKAVDTNGLWVTRDEFLAWDLTNLRRFMEDTKVLQTQFMIDRMYDNIKTMPLTDEQHDMVDMLLSTDDGMYILVDYTNFKGTGMDEAERFNNQGWGLYQVLRNMEVIEKEYVKESFANAAVFILERLTVNNPKSLKFLEGWKKRLATYTE